jgi:hypothetical protein
VTRTKGPAYVYAHLVRMVGADLEAETTKERKARGGGNVNAAHPRCFLLSDDSAETYAQAAA